MHPSSFYDLRARYIYTPLYGPYSLSEALEGLIFYSLDESQDSVSISSKRALRHELVSELSNVTDDLQDYLVYFSSTFLISPSNSPDFTKELQASRNGLKYLSVCWGAIISRLVIACKIVEHNFWPQLFQPTIDNLAALQRSGQPRSFVLPNRSSNKSFASASGFISSPSTPHSPCCPFELQCLMLNEQSERLKPMPSKTDPTGGKESRALSSRFNTTPTLSGSHPTQILSKHQPSDITTQLHFPQVDENHPDGVFAPPKLAFAAQHICSSTPTYKSGTRELVDSKNDAEGKEMDEQVTGEIGVPVKEENATNRLYIHPHPVKLTSIQGDPTRGLITTTARTPALSLVSSSTSMSPNISNPNPSLHWGHSVLSPHSFAKAIPHPLARSPPPMALQPMSIT